MAFRIWISVVICLLYIAACSSQVFEKFTYDYFNWGHGGHVDLPWYGYQVLMLGWFPPYTVPWFANVLLLVGWIFLLLNINKSALAFGIAATVVALTTWVFRTDPRGEQRELLGGYYCWQGSMIALMVGAFANLLLQRGKELAAGKVKRARPNERAEGDDSGRASGLAIPVVSVQSLPQCRCLLP